MTAPRALFTVQLNVGDARRLFRAMELAELQLLADPTSAGLASARNDAFQLALLRALLTRAFVRQGFALVDPRPARTRPRDRRPRAGSS